MYNAIKHSRFGAKAKAAIVAVLCAAYLLCFAAVGYAAPTKRVHVDGTLKMEFVDAEIISMNSIDEAASSVSFNGDTMSIVVDGMKCPGAGAVIRVTAKNTGTLKADLVSVKNSGTDIEFIKVELPDNLCQTVAPGKTCTFDIAVYWDPAHDDVTELNFKTDFTIVLTYENNEYIEIPSGGDPDDDPNGNNSGNKNNGNKNNGNKNNGNVPKTGDLANYNAYAIAAAVAAVVMIVCLIFIIFGKKKKKEDDE